MNMLPRKQCKKCLETKPLARFPKVAKMKDGYLNHCKDCKNTKAKALRKENPEHYYKWYRENADLVKERAAIYRAKTRPAQLERERAWNAANKEVLSERQRKYRAKDSHKFAARSSINVAIKLGNLVRPFNCSECHKFCTPDGHHDDYSKPLEVRWLCRQCHVAHHANERRSA